MRKMGLAKIQLHPFQIYGRGKKILKIGPWTLTTALLGYFVMLQMGHAKVYLCIEFEVSSFTHSKFMEEVSKFKNLPHPIWGFCHP